MLIGRQIAWMIAQNFKLNDTEASFLEWDELVSVTLKGDNLVQFQNDWESTCLSVRDLPDERFLESLYRKQLEKSVQLQNAMALYWQDITLRGEHKTYQKLKTIVYKHIEHK